MIDGVINVQTDCGAKGYPYDDTAAVKRAAVDVPKGGAVLFPPGSWVVDGGAVDIGKPCTIMGRNRGGTSIISRTGADLFRVNAPDVVFQQLDMRSWATPATLTAARSAAIVWESGDWGEVERCFFEAWYRHVDFVSAAHWSLERSRFGAAVKDAVRVRNVARPDAGDQTMNGCDFTSPWATETFIRQESGGGLKITGSKFLLGAAVMIDVAVADDVTTSILTVTGCSLEHARQSFVRIGQAGPGNTGTFQKVAVTGNQFSVTRNTGPAIDIVGRGAGNTDIREVSVTGNNMRGSRGRTEPMVSVRNAACVNVTGNQFATHEVGVAVDRLSVNVETTPNSFFGITTPRLTL